jgi:hypothetical protein
MIGEPYHRGVEDRPGSSRDRLLLGLLGIGGLVLLTVGLALLAPTKLLGFDLVAALRALATQAPRTVQPGLTVAAVTGLELAAGLAIGRLVRRDPFDSIADAALAAMLWAVLKDLILVGVLAQVGWFRAPVLYALDIAVVLSAALVLPARPVFDLGAGPSELRDWLRSRVSLAPLVLLVGAVWAGPVLLQLASPVVPFIDVLPNHVAPAEHLRVFGVFDPLTATQSPIYGPSRTLLGYLSFAGAIVTMSGITAAIAISGLILPTTLLAAAAVHRLGRAIGGKNAAWWSLLAFATTVSFARLGDVRATVVVLPLVAWSFALVADALGGRRRPRAILPEGVLLGLGLGAAVTLHPVIGALAVATVVVVGMVLPATAGRLVLVATPVAVLAGAPQALTMLGLSLPALVLPLAIGAAIALGWWLDRGLPARIGALPDRHIALGWIGGATLIVAVLVGALLDEGVAKLVTTNALLLALVVVGAWIGAPALRSPVILAAGAVGLAVAIATAFIPDHGLGLLGTALRFELPKTLTYWLPVIAALAAGSVLARAWSGPETVSAAEPAPADGTPARARAGALPRPILRAGVAVAVLLAVVPLRPEPIDAFHLGEHRLAEDLAIDLRFIERGFWSGYPDSRRLVDGPRIELIEAVRGEIEAGRIGPNTPVLHVAVSFQQWVATPLGVFTGVTETDVSPDAEHSIHTVGGRLRDMADLASLLAGGAYPYLLFEPSPDLPPGTLELILAAGYRETFSNGQGTLYRLGG